MATAQDRTARPAPFGKYDAAVEAQLARARQRIRALDLAVGFSGLLAGTLSYALIVTLLDRAIGLSPMARQVAFISYLLAALLYITLVLVRPLFRPINPYFTARRIEETIPGAKNSIINWLDLHDEPLPSAIQGALSQRAARDLAKAKLEQALTGRRAAWVGGLAGALFLALLVSMVWVGPGQFFSLLERAFRPFSAGGIATRTRLTLLRPEGGDATVPAGRSVAFAVYVEGKIPHPKKDDALRLQFRYRPSDPYETLPLERENDREWTVTLPAAQVNNGFWYKVTGGDAETPEYRVRVRPTPLVETYRAAYKYRPYLHWPDDTRLDGDLKDLRGTEVTLTVRANCPVKEGRLELEAAKKTIPGERLPDDPCALRFPGLVLEQDDRYRIAFLSADGEPNEPTPKTITVIPDYPPQVKITRPEEDETKVQANGLLKVEGWASDDIGVKSVTLRTQVVDGPELLPKVYREGTSFQLSDGGYPKMLDYKDALDLSQAKDRDGKEVALRPGMVLEYWLEAADDCDFPQPHTGASKPRKRALLVEPEKDPQKQQQERRQAAEEQKQHEAKQDEKLAQEDQQRRQDGKAGNSPKNPEQQKKDQELEKDAERVRRELEKQKERQEGQAKGRSQPEKGQAKDGGKPEQQGEQGRAEGKPEGQPDPKQQPAEGKKDGPGQSQDQGQAKGAGQNSGKPEPQPGDTKPEQSAAQGQGKNEGRDAGTKEQAGGARDAGKPQPQGGAQGEQKPASPEKGNGDARADGKGADKRPSSQAQAREQARNARPEDVQQLAKDLQGGDAKQQQEAADKLDQISRNAGNPQARDAARQALEQANRLPGKEAKPEDAKQQTRDLQSGDPQKQQEAADKLDQMARNAADPQTRAAARQALEKAERHPGENARPPDVTQQAKDLQNSDPHKRQQAAEKLDQMARNAHDERVRQAARQELEKAKQQPGQDAKPEDIARQEKQLQSGDRQQQRDAADKLEQISRNASDPKVRDAARQALEQAEQRPQEFARPEDVARQVKDLQSGDAQKEKQAAEKLDAMARNAKDEQVRDAARQALQQAKQHPGQDAKPEDVAKQEKALQQNDPKQQREAADKLDQIRQNARDEKARAQAQKALEEALRRMQQEQSPAQAKESPKAEGQAAAKKGPPEEQQGAAKQEQKPPEAPGNGKTADPGQVDAQAKERGETDNHPLAPWKPGTGDGPPDRPPLAHEEPRGGAADSRHRERGGVLQLEDLKSIDKKVQDQLGWSAERLKQFQKAYEEMLKRRQAEARSSEDRPAGPSRGGSLGNIGAQQVQPVQGSPVDARSLGRGQPPPGYQDAEREFRRRLADLDAPPEKK